MTAAETEATYLHAQHCRNPYILHRGHLDNIGSCIRGFLAFTTVILSQCIKKIVLLRRKLLYHPIVSDDHIRVFHEATRKEQLDVTLQSIQKKITTTRSLLNISFYSEALIVLSLLLLPFARKFNLETMGEALGEAQRAREDKTAAETGGEWPPAT